jgi:hypothetical protein
MLRALSALLVAAALHHKDGSILQHGSALARDDNGTASESVGEETAGAETQATETQATEPQAENATKNASKGPEPKATALRCELLLDVSLEFIHEQGGIEAFANAAQSEIATAGGLDKTCVHVMNLRGKYEHGMKALDLMQVMRRFLRRNEAKVIVDFEILPQCSEPAGEAFTKVETQLHDTKSGLRNGWLSSFLSSKTAIVKAGEVSEKAMEDTTMSMESTAVVIAAAALFLTL